MTSRLMRGLLAHVLMGAVMIQGGASVAAEGDDIGETQMCVPLQQISDRRVIDDRTILLKMIVGPTYKRIDLARDCRGLKAEGGFVSATSISKLCRQDILRVTQEPIGSQCIIDRIVTIDEAEAKALIEKRKNDRKNRE
ncbi:MAG: hypothetical protein K2P94_18385 [Rhodospirillaceae bacterium]|nr:hypothetical protein [Rhodospirillaceae bacterium]